MMRREAIMLESKGASPLLLLGDVFSQAKTVLAKLEAHLAMLTETPEPL